MKPRIYIRRLWEKQQLQKGSVRKKITSIFSNVKNDKLKHVDFCMVSLISLTHLMYLNVIRCMTYVIEVFC